MTSLPSPSSPSPSPARAPLARLLLTTLALLTASIYLFVTAPPPLPLEGEGEEEGEGAWVPIEEVLSLVAAENDAARALYTSAVVGDGQAAGLKFGERWREEGVEEGPLPALFLRAAAESLSRQPLPLALFLGSDQPISPSNSFVGRQQEEFKEVKSSRAPRFFFAEDTQRHTAMFPDLASVAPCVRCHNEHPQTPKRDWALNDVMGATTWSYPKARVTLREALALLAATRAAFADAYGAYLKKAATFNPPPEVGARWPKEGRALPSREVFLSEHERRSSGASLRRLLALKRGRAP